MGDQGRLRDLVQRVDELTIGPAILGVTLVINGDPSKVRVRFIPDGAVANFLEAQHHKRKRRAVKVRLIHGGQTLIGWVERRFLFRNDSLKRRALALEEEV